MSTVFNRQVAAGSRPLLDGKFAVVTGVASGIGVQPVDLFTRGASQSSARTSTRRRSTSPRLAAKQSTRGSQEATGQSTFANPPVGIADTTDALWDRPIGINTARDARRDPPIVPRTREHSGSIAQTRASSASPGASPHSLLPCPRGWRDRLHAGAHIGCFEHGTPCPQPTSLLVCRSDAQRCGPGRRSTRRHRRARQVLRTRGGEPGGSFALLDLIWLRALVADDRLGCRTGHGLLDHSSAAAT